MSTLLLEIWDGGKFVGTFFRPRADFVLSLKEARRLHRWLGEQLHRIDESERNERLERAAVRP